MARFPHMGDSAVEIRRWTRIEYERLADAEILGSLDRVELLDGHMVVKEPQASPHITAIRLVQRALIAAFGRGWDVREQAPIALDDESEPEPDISVVAGDPRDYRDAHPQRPALIVEVARSRLAFDREHKGSLYVYRDPMPDAGAVFGRRYGLTMARRPEEHVSPLAAPGAVIPIADLP
jgi:Uma2 family endonuclease